MSGGIEKRKKYGEPSSRLKWSGSCVIGSPEVSSAKEQGSGRAGEEGMGGGDGDVDGEGDDDDEEEEEEEEGG